VVHVSGTKGKGSTCALTASILNAYRAKAGLPRKVGLYTSPHLVSVRERININGAPLSEEQFAAAFFHVWSKLDLANAEQKPTYFRLLTLMSFHVFMTEGVDAAVYEVGLGGEFDSTNVFDLPAATGVTSLGIDHVRTLGHTLSEISWHKAGIFKPGSPAFTVEQEPEAMKTLEDRAGEKGVVLARVGIHPGLVDVRLVPAEEFQRKNASLAMRLAVECMGKLGVDVDISSESLPETVVEGLEMTRWRGRCEVLEANGRTWYLDGAHNEQSLKVASTWFARASEKDVPCVLIFNQQSERDASALLHFLHKCLADAKVQLKYAVFCTNTAYNNQTKLGALPATPLGISNCLTDADFVNANADGDAIKTLSLQRQLVDTMKSLDPSIQCVALGSIQDAVDFATSKNVQVFVTGSLHLVGGAIAVLEGQV
jgi:folylpolyglutamate synthase